MQIYAFLISIFLIHSAFSQNNIDKAILNFQRDAVNKNGSISFLAIDLQTGEKIGELNADKAITSASTTKLFSTAAALEILGSDKKTTTRIYHSGKINKNGELIGDIWIRGGGDVTLGSKYFSKEATELDFLQAWADSLILKGIKKVNGFVVADASEFGYNGTPLGWHADDIGNYYGAFAGGLNFYDNLIKISLKTGNAGSKSEIIDVFPAIPNLRFSNAVIAANVTNDQSSISGLTYSLNREITGRLPANRARFIVKGSMPDPEFLLAQEFIRVLNSKGIEVTSGVKTVRIDKVNKPNYETDLKLLFQQESKTIKEIAFWTNYKSVNLFAEGLLNLLGYFTSGNGTTEAGLNVLKNYWQDKINTSKLVLNDGSGLSRLNAISAENFCSLLKFMASSPNYDVFKSTLPIAGKNGTISSLCKGEVGEGRIFAKSGTFKSIKSFAGYVDSKSGKRIAFAFTVSDFKCSTNEISLKMAHVLNSLAEL